MALEGSPIGRSRAERSAGRLTSELPAPLSSRTIPFGRQVVSQLKRWPMAFGVSVCGGADLLSVRIGARCVSARALDRSLQEERAVLGRTSVRFLRLRAA